VDGSGQPGSLGRVLERLECLWRTSLSACPFPGLHAHVLLAMWFRVPCTCSMLYHLSPTAVVQSQPLPTNGSICRGNAWGGLSMC
jgi:hypothetical protein